MPHPNGGQGSVFATLHTFQQAIAFVGQSAPHFQSTTGEAMTASLGTAGDGQTALIVLQGVRNIHGRVCERCWGYSKSCTGERVSHAVGPLDGVVP